MITSAKNVLMFLKNFKVLKKCPKCSGKINRLIGGGAGVIFKGSGFYEIDYKRASQKKPPCGDASGCVNQGACCPK